MATTPISGYAGPLSRVDWVARYFSLHQGYFRLTWRAIPIFLGLIAVAVILGVMGPPIRHLNWIIGVALQIGALPFLLMPGNFVATWMFGYIAGQPGGEKGFDIKDGTLKGAEYVKKFGRSIGYVLFFGALPFMALGLFDIRPNPIGAVIVLALSVSLTIGGLMLFQDAKWFMGFVWTIYLMITLWILAGFIPGLRELQNGFVQAGNRFIATRLVSNDADNAKIDAEQRLRNKRIQVAKACYDQLPDDASPDAKAKCDALQKAVDGSLLEDAAKAASSVVGRATSSATATTSTAAQTFSNCQQPGRPVSFQKELIYCPGLANGPQSFGKLDTPKRFKLVCEGTRQMRVYGGGGAKDWTVDCEGNGFNGAAGTTPAPDHWSFTLKGEAIGKVVAYADGVSQQLGSCFDAKDEVRVDANDGHYRQGGHGGLRVRLVEC